MTDTWGEPTVWVKTGDEDTPYIHWWRTQEANSPQHSDFRFAEIKLTPNKLSPATLNLPIPSYATNPGEFGDFKREDVADQLTPDKVGKVPENTVLIGIVDTGIPLGHRRTRTASGETRFISSWQQNAAYTGQDNLPFGRELFAQEINCLMKEHSNCDLTKPLNEDAFTRDAGLTVSEALSGDRELDHRFSHGAHVLDLAAGHDPLCKNNDAIQNTRIISVNLPPQKVHGTAGNFLTIYAALAIERILFIADALWAVQHNKKAGAQYPLVLNFSFGKNAGPKDGNSVWETIIAELIEKRKKLSPTHLVMPAGNQNLSRGNARKLLGPDPSGAKKPPLDPVLEVPLVVHPEDHTSNFVEIWAKAQRPEDAEEDSEVKEADHKDFRLFVTPPGRAEMEIKGLHEPGKYSQLGDYARVYCYAPFGQMRPHYVLCIAPTVSVDGLGPTAPAGIWTIKFEYTGTQVQEVTFGVQTDLSGIRSSKTGLRSYFDHPDYETHLETGRVRDSYVDRTFVPVKYVGGHTDSWSKYGPVQRKGSHNALASWPSKENDEGFFTVVGGYRISDGAPAIYSSTFDGDSRRELGRETPTALYPSDDTPSHFGLLAAGSKEGSVVALQGTSMATGLATRDIARAFAARCSKDPKVDDTWVKNKAKRRQYVNGLKGGKGMVDYPGIGRIPRHGGDWKQEPFQEKEGASKSKG